MKPKNTVCVGCGQKGYLAHAKPGDSLRFYKPRWCRCPAGKTGPLNAAPGFVTVYRFESTASAAKREEGRLLGNAFHHAKDDLSLRWVRCGRGYRELPRGNPKRERLERAYTMALRALRRFQRSCSHPSRSVYFHYICDVCNADLRTAEEHAELDTQWNAAVGT